MISQNIKADSFDYYDRKDRFSYDQRPQEKMKLYEYIVIIIINHLKISYLYILRGIFLHFSKDSNYPSATVRGLFAAIDEFTDKVANPKLAKKNVEHILS